MPLSVGDRLGPYEILGLIGAGGMGEVWKALDSRLGRVVAIKRLKRPRGARFEQEARAIASLNHPNICQLYDIGPDYLVMEYVDGEPLHGPLSVDESVRIALQIASALAEAHRRGILHRDIKPNNIVLTAKGEAKLLDFGLAKLVSEDPELTQSMEGALLGTPAYMSPEQARGQPLDARSDLFSLGAVLYECLSGRRAFPGDSSIGALLDVVATEPPAPSKISAEVPRRLDDVVRKLLAKDRQGRYASADDLIVDLQNYRTPKPFVPSPLLVWSAVLLVVLLAAGAFWWTRGFPHFATSRGSRQIVVLPFKDLSGAQDAAAFGEGLSDVVNGVLTRRGIFPATLWVIPSGDVRRFGVKTVADAQRVFQANLTVGGTVRRISQGDGWVITLVASDPSRPASAKSREIRLADPEAEMENDLTAALLDLLGVAGHPSPQGSPIPSAAYARFVVARGYLRQYDQGDHLQRAIADLENITASSPNYAPAQVALSEAYFRTYTATKEAEWLAKADQAVRRASEIDPSAPDAPVMRGRILRATGQIDAAIHELKIAIARDPGDEAALVQLAGAYESSKQFADAESTYEKAIRLRPSYFPAYTNLGIFYMSQGKWAQAEQPLTIATKLAPQYADGYTTLGSLLYYLDRLDDAQRLFTRSIELRPTATAYSNRCAVEFDKRNLDAAVADCRKAVELQPASAIALGNLGDTLAQSGNAAEAAETYRRALDAGNKLLAINPTNPDLLASMAKFAAKTGQKDLAIQLAGRSLNQGSSVRALYNAGKAYGLAGQCPRSIDLLKQAFEKGYPKQEARRDPDLTKLRTAPFACDIPTT